MVSLYGKVAVVTGASRGVGKGVALGLGEAGATVYVTGRTTEEGSAPLPGTIGETTAEVTRLGGQGIAVRCDHRNDEEVKAVFERVRQEQGRLDILVNNVFHVPSPPEKIMNRPFWEVPIEVWDQMHTIGLRSHYVASVFAAPIMIEQGSGLICNISSLGGKGYLFNVAYGVGKAAVDRLAADMAHELRARNVTVVSLWPGGVKTELMMSLADRVSMDVSGFESPQFTGRAVAALAADPDVMQKTGRVLVVAELADEYGFTDIDGSRPASPVR